MSRTTRTSQVRDEIRRFLAVRPVQVGELDLTGGGAVLRPGPGSPPVTSGPVFVLVRREGRPVGTLLGEVPEGADPKATLSELAQGVGQLEDTTEPATGPPPPYTTVVIATRERTGKLVHALDSMLAQDHPRFEIVVVDNAPATRATRDLVREKYAERVRYVCEPVPGLAVAHNRGVAAARGEVVAFTDDDVVADPRWLTELTSPFAADPGLGCTTGLILPARLRTPAQVLLESHGGFSKGFVPRTYDPAAPPADEPLFPFTAGRFGSGASMAFRTRVLREVRGFDPATGAGTLARGGDDLYGFVRVLARGYRLHYTPYALVWHHHRETWRDLETQAYGYGAGLGAYLTAVLVNSPGLVPGFLARLPKGVAYARALTASRGVEGGRGDSTARPASAGPGVHGDRDHPWPRRLSRLQRRGMLYGPVGYLRARWALRAAWGRGAAR
ncbi:glycosyltransferase [Streptomyces acidiscabies]|uniref:Glycosyltransferase n=1 Tax=Streptomyces acidiscabies TaxID=42234 RepID=A0AAP6B9Y1_9ACTN|nr:glycosyltransferase [Streptomyces acidiscabies]MBP5937651.1 glycosyltransferase [Streptomyces sp. LBUM 1476]MDX2960881.1 glycosyltransferase [Streptomyces acidiscabies]MDX3016938.1 glycosyltransferase [Streptomyces acidiscabies]MDX3788890.1 glycosyltransferase [Streptomyces acidiscabies]GAV45997.1 N-glycosyltransferase [Streptomyces acidiscabies]